MRLFSHPPLLFPWNSAFLVHTCIVFTTSEVSFVHFFLLLDFCRFCAVIPFFLSLPQRPMTSDFEDFYPIFYPIHMIVFPILILEKEAAVFPFLMLISKQGNYCRYCFYNFFGMTWSLTGDWTRDLHHSNSRLSRKRFFCSLFCLKSLNPVTASMT
mgnify:CR=1 FL=1